MKTLVIIAAHHGSFLTIKSALKNSSHDKLIVLVPRSQVDKYNKMYEENIHKSSEFEIFKDYDKLVTNFCGTEVFVVDDWDSNNTVSSTIDVLRGLESKGNHFVVGAGLLILTDPFTPQLLEKLNDKRIIIGKTRVYGEDKRLNMYHMIGMPREDQGFDANVFAVNVDLFEEIPTTDSKLIQDSIFVKKMEKLPRGFNMKHDPLIGTAISARETVMHNVRSVQACIINFWMPAIKKYEDLYSEETFGYPFDVYLDYAEQVEDYLPASTYNRIKQNGEATKYWIKDIRDNILG
tara:strand:- start:1805 stop:2680 length:876 start_codon:yes stop_codon:yes gene_type:complete